MDQSENSNKPPSTNNQETNQPQGTSVQASPAPMQSHQSAYISELTEQKTARRTIFRYIPLLLSAILSVAIIVQSLQGRRDDQWFAINFGFVLIWLAPLIILSIIFIKRPQKSSKRDYWLIGGIILTLFWLSGIPWNVGYDLITASVDHSRINNYRGLAEKLDYDIYLPPLSDDGKLDQYFSDWTSPELYNDPVVGIVYDSSFAIAEANATKVHKAYSSCPAVYTWHSFEGKPCTLFTTTPKGAKVYVIGEKGLGENSIFRNGDFSFEKNGTQITFDSLFLNNSISKNSETIAQFVDSFEKVNAIDLKYYVRGVPTSIK